MTTAHRPTFDAARGKDNKAPTLQFSSRDLAAHTKLKFRSAGQGTTSETAKRDLRAELLAAEAKHFEKKRKLDAGEDATEVNDDSRDLRIEGAESDEPEDAAAKRQRILAEAAVLDKDDSEEEEEEQSEADSDDDEDETAELLRELEKIKRERAEEREKQEREQHQEQDKLREEEIMSSNPLLNLQSQLNGGSADFGVKRRWDDDVVFKHQAKQEKPEKRFVNDVLRSDFHRKFMSKYIR